MPQAIDRSRGWLTPTSVRSGKMVCQRLCTKFIYRIKQVCLLLDTSGLQSDLLVVEARANFFGQVPQRSGQSSIGKLTCQNLRQYTVNTNLRPNGHTRAYSPGKQNLFSNRGPLPKPTTKNQTTSNRLTQSQPFHVHLNQQTTSNRPTKKNG